MTRRRLRPDEIELWHKVAETAQKMHPERKVPAPVAPKPKPRKTPQARIPEFNLGQAAKHSTPPHQLAPAISDALRARPVAMDRKTFTRMSKGKLVPEGRIDLHGMTLERAHNALVRFMLMSHSRGRRLVLVITGKGKDRDEGGPIPVRRGVLRHQVPHWLEVPPLAQVVLQVIPAHISHGGEGAYYVYLKRSR
jgi:DNA-nicking Smr family endonuclease